MSTAKSSASSALRAHLLQAVNDEKAQFMTLADQFYAQSHRNEADYAQFCRDMIEAIDSVLAAGDWDSALFLRNTAKPLRQIRERAQQILTQLTGEVALATHDHVAAGCAHEQVYIALFQSKGHDLAGWAMQLRSLHRYVAGRPIYRHEADIVASIRAKINQETDAYVIFSVPEECIEAPLRGVPRQDRQGRDLIALKSNAIEAGRIVAFVHAGKRYRFIDNQLKVIETDV